MLARCPIVLAGALVALLTLTAQAEDRQFGALDFSRLTQPQEQFFWRRLKSLAFEEAVISYCGQPDDFEQTAKQGIQACVTEEALNKAESVFKSELKASKDSLRLQKTSCHEKPDAIRGWLGVDLAAVGKGASDSVAAGALVVNAFENSPAAQADVRAGDVITSADGQSVANPKDLIGKIHALAPGANVQLNVLRDGAGRTLSVKLGAMAFDKEGKVAFDMPALIASSREDLNHVSGEVTEMCQKCKTTIWAVFCR